jgi:hypothetical protein
LSEPSLWRALRFRRRLIKSAERPRVMAPRYICHISLNACSSEAMNPHLLELKELYEIALLQIAPKKQRITIGDYTRN